MHQARRIHSGNRGILRSPGQRDIRARIAVGVARGGGQAVCGSSGKRCGRHGNINARDVRPADSNVRIANLLADHRFDCDFARSHKRHFAAIFGNSGIKRRRVPMLDRFRQRLAVGILDDSLELKFGADRRRGLERRDLDSRHLGVLCRLFLRFLRRLASGQTTQQETR